MEIEERLARLEEKFDNLATKISNALDQLEKNHESQFKLKTDVEVLKVKFDSFVEVKKNGQKMLWTGVGIVSTIVSVIVGKLL